MKTLSELGISKAPWGTYQTKKEVAVTTSVEGFGDLESALCRGPNRKSNASLIAAAPKLYECLREAIIEKCHDCIGKDIESDACKDNTKGGNCFVKKWRAALAEAAGESEANDG